MKTRKRTEIKVETHEVTILRFRQNKKIFCKLCGMNTLHLSLDQVAVLLSLAESEIQSLAEARQLHSNAAANGTLFLCGNSLAMMKQK